MSIELNKESVEQADASSCQGTNCGTTTGDHSSECLAEAAAGQGWELKPGDLCGRDCPIHKISVEQAGGDERAALQELIRVRDWVKNRRGQPEKLKNTGQTYIMIEKCETLDMLEWAIERARAALAKPSPKCATCNDSGQIVVSGPHYQGEFQPPEYETEPCDMCAQPSPAQAEQAEVERPEVVARVDGTDEDWFIQPEDETELHNEGLLFAGCELGRMIDFDRIVGELRADRDSWAEQAEQRLADWDEMRKERDAALARVAELKTMSHNYCALLMDANAKLAELEKQEPINLQHMAVAADGELRWMTGRKIDNCELYAMPDFGQAPKLYAAPVALVQHSVPELLVRAEDFVSGFEDDDEQEGVSQLLADLRTAIGRAN